MLQYSQKWINDQLEDWKIEQQKHTARRPIDDYGKYHIHLFIQ